MSLCHRTPRGPCEVGSHSCEPCGPRRVIWPVCVALSCSCQRTACHQLYFAAQARREDGGDAQREYVDVGWVRQEGWKHMGALGVRSGAFLL